MLKCFIPPAATWSEILGAPPPVSEDIPEPAADGAIRDSEGTEELLERMKKVEGDG